MTTNRLIAGLLVTSAMGSTAFAGGLERATFSSGLIFNEGTYAEITFALTNPKVTQTTVPEAFSGEMAPSFNTVRLGYKQDLSDKLSFALDLNGNPMGVDVDYTSWLAGPNSTEASVESKSLTALAKYQATERVSVYGGLTYIEASATANLSDVLVDPDQSFVFAKDSGVGFLLGAAYEIPAIALRAALTYESKVDLTHAASYAADGEFPGFAAGFATSGKPEVINLEFQTGIAADTLLTASIRHSKASETNVVFNGSPLSTFDDVTGYSLGIARRLNDNWAISGGIYYEARGAGPFSPLAPTNGNTSLSIGARYSAPETGLTVSMGMSHSIRGDVVAAGMSFENNHVNTFGVRIGKQF